MTPCNFAPRIAPTNRKPRIASIRSDMTTHISGFLTDPKRNAAKQIYRGKFTCPNVQKTGDGPDSVVTFTITAEELADAAEAGLIWTDQDVQRGIVPGSDEQTPRQISLADGYPEAGKYIFSAENADDIVEKLLAGDRLFLNSLIWNLRPGKFEAFDDVAADNIYIYSGKIYLPDSHHRHQAIIKAVQLWRDAPKDYPKFKGDRQFKVELYFLDREDEGNYFFDKNNRPTPTAKSKGYDLSTADDLSVLAKRVIEKSSALSANVNRVTDRLTKANPQVITLSTLREMMKSFAPDDSIDSSELDGLALVASAFYDNLAKVRPELGVLSTKERREVRDSKLVDAAVMMHGYAALMRDYNQDLAQLGNARASKLWSERLQRLSSANRYRLNRWSGDLFDKRNPLWLALGVTKPSKNVDRLTVVNTGGARGECGRALRQICALATRQEDLKFLVAK